MAKHFDPAFECYKRKIGPKDSEKAVKKKCYNPPIILNYLRQPDLPVVEDVKTRGYQHHVHQSIEGISLVGCAQGNGKMESGEPLRNRSGSNKHHPNDRQPDRAAYIWPLPSVPPEKKEDEGECASKRNGLRQADKGCDSRSNAQIHNDQMLQVRCQESEDQERRAEDGKRRTNGRGRRL